MIFHLAKIFILLIAGHALCDIPLQNPYLSNAKRGNDPNFPAWLALAYHAAIHAGAVLLITNSIAAAIVEWASHFAIDSMRCKGAISGKQDQALHIVYKIAYLFMIWRGMP